MPNAAGYQSTKRYAFARASHASVIARSLLDVINDWSPKFEFENTGEDKAAEAFARLKKSDQRSIDDMNIVFDAFARLIAPDFPSSAKSVHYLD